ncbi:hypothetical protein LC593_25905 [Nostoc sp. CHAB 5844]|nr:hypothetical protein [Nostoc sp. CHAB 5844]
MPYPYNIELPKLVIRAHEQAERLGFPMMPQARSSNRKICANNDNYASRWCASSRSCCWLSSRKNMRDWYWCWCQHSLAHQWYVAYI